MVDPDEDDYEMHTRTSPRFTGKKPTAKDIVEEENSDSSSETRPRKKMKTQSKANPKKANAKQNVGFKCSPHLLHDLFKSLDKDQKLWVEELGFGVLLSMPNCRLPKGLTVWLINHVSWKKRALVVGGKTIRIKDVIKKVLGIPDGPFPVPMPRSNRGKSKGPNTTLQEKDTKADKSGRGISYKETFEALIANHDRVQFKRDFMLYVLCIYFAPSSGHFINRSYSAIISNVDLIKDMNWCEHVAEFLIEGIREYRESRAANVNVHGCVHVLLLIYIDMVKSALIKVPEGTPRINYVTSEMLDLLDYLDLKYTSNDGPEYGKLEIDQALHVDEGKPVNQQSTTATSAKKNIIPDCSTSTANVNGDGKSDRVPKCPNSTAPDVGENYYWDELSKIESQYNKERQSIYSECLQLLNTKINKIDSIRCSAIGSLHKKLFSTVNLGSPRFDGVINVDCSPSRQKSNSQPERQDGPTRTPDFSTPNKDSSGIDTSLGQKRNEFYEAHNPQEFSFRVHPRNPVRKMNVRFLSPTQDKACTSAIKAAQDGDLTRDHLDISNDSYDLQHTCHQLSTVFVRRDGGSRLGNPVKSFKSGRLFQENHTPVTDIPGEEPEDTSDPLGFDLMAEVMAIGKESEKQAVVDAGVKDTMADGTHIGMVGVNSRDTCSFPVQCAQQEQASIAQTSVGPASLSPCQVDLTQQKFNSSQCVNSESQYSEDMFSDDSIEKAAALIAEDQPINPAFTVVSSVIDNQPGPFSCQSSDLSAPARGGSDEAFVTQKKECRADIPDALYIPLSPENYAHKDNQKVVPLTSPIEDGEFFGVAGSVNIAVRARAKRFGKRKENIDGIAELKKSPCKNHSEVNLTYAEHVENSCFRVTKRKKASSVCRVGGDEAKIIIRGVHVTAEEFVHTLMPNGEVDLNFMWLCCVAIMLDWGSKTKTILNQPTIKELMKPPGRCDHQLIAAKLKKLQLHSIDQIYLPVCNADHWILILVSLSGELVEIYDSLKPYKIGEDPYKDLWETIGYNLQVSYQHATSKAILLLDKFQKQYAQIHTQDNLHDSGLEIIRILVSHNGKNLIGYGKKSMASFRKEVAHILIYHRYNDLNPRRHNPVLLEDV